jgi:hypothetical protein
LLVELGKLTAALAVVALQRLELTHIHQQAALVQLHL